jgi:hypothetical protein
MRRSIDPLPYPGKDGSTDYRDDKCEMTCYRLNAIGNQVYKCPCLVPVDSWPITEFKCEPERDEELTNFATGGRGCGS